uniref:Uncharacterized protein n=1 Tax=Timema douglasi TaxID=61478 RepID=A0A7R8VIE9_TIMDO|nr:unnamed protein product [Timema douglasi]
MIGEKETSLYVLDCVFSVTVIGSLVVFVWRGAWTILDIYLLPSSPDLSAWGSLVLGYGIVFFTFALQTPMKLVCNRLKGIPRLLVADIYLFLSFCGTVNVWRGIWNLLNIYFIPGTLSYLTAESASYQVRYHISQHSLVHTRYTITSHSRFCFIPGTLSYLTAESASYQVHYHISQQSLLHTRYTIISHSRVCFIPGTLSYLTAESASYQVHYHISQQSLLHTRYTIISHSRVCFVSGTLSYLTAESASYQVHYHISQQSLLRTRYAIISHSRVCFIPENLELSYWVTYLVSLLVLILLNCSNSILVRGVYIDGEEEGGKCVVFPCYYLRLYFQIEVGFREPLPVILTDIKSSSAFESYAWHPTWYRGRSFVGHLPDRTGATSWAGNIYRPSLTNVFLVTSQPKSKRFGDHCCFIRKDTFVLCSHQFRLAMFPSSQSTGMKVFDNAVLLGDFETKRKERLQQLQLDHLKKQLSVAGATCRKGDAEKGGCADYPQHQGNSTGNHLQVPLMAAHLALDVPDDG